MSISGQQTARDVLNTVLRAGYAQVIPQDGLISAVREGVKEPSGIITPHEQTQPVRVGFKAPSEDDFNGVDVEYVDETWKINRAVPPTWRNRHKGGNYQR